MKSPLVIPRYTHNTSRTINMLVLGGSYMYVNKPKYNTHFLYKCSSHGTFYDNPKEAYRELIRHEITEGITNTPIASNKYK